MPTLYLHIGPSKTATSFLQWEVLPEIEMCCYVKPTVTLGSAEMRLGDVFLFSPDLWRGETGKELFTFLRDGDVEEKDVLVSSEYIFGGLASPQPWIPDGEAYGSSEYGPVVRVNRQTEVRLDRTSFSNHLDALKEAGRQQGFSQVRILFTTRRQDTKLASGYAQVSNRVRGASQQNFERWAHHLTDDSAGFLLGGGQKLNYFAWWKAMTEVLGRSNVFFLPFELLRKNQGAFLRRWLKFMEVEGYDSIADSFVDEQEENKRSTSESTWSIADPIRRGPFLHPTRVFRALGLPTRLPARWPDFQRDKEIQLTRELSEEIMEVYEKENRLLDEQGLNLNLKEYGYY